MRQSILVGGISGTGKSTLSETLRQRGYAAVDLDDSPGLFTMIDTSTGKPFENYEQGKLEHVERLDWHCDIKKLSELIAARTEDVGFYCGGASNIKEVFPLFDTIVLLVADKEMTNERLSTRTSNDFGRTKEVQDWINTHRNEWNDFWISKGAVVVDANQDKQKVAEEVLAKIAINSK